MAKKKKGSAGIRKLPHFFLLMEQSQSTGYSPASSDASSRSTQSPASVGASKASQPRSPVVSTPSMQSPAKSKPRLSADSSL